jgi:hypothetical protein
MIRLATMAFVIAIALFPFGNARAQMEPIIGRWSATVDWQTAGGVYMILQIAPDGRLYEHTQNHQGMAYDLAGAYQFDPATGVFQYRWTDYGPKQICMPAGCTPLPTPQPMGVVTTVRIRFMNRNEFIGITSDGQTTWVRMN